MPNGKSSELSQRELDILKLVATGASNKEIAQQLFISLNTVKVHLRNIFGKIGVASRTEAAMYAVRIGLVETAAPQLPADEGQPESEQAKTDAKNRRTYLLIGVTSGLIVVLLIIGFATNFGNIFAVKTAAAPTITPRVQWFQLAGLPNPRWSLAVANYENQIYAIGGESSAGVTGTTEKYDPQTSKWIELASKPIAVTDASAVTTGGLIVVPGGKLASGIPTDVNEVYDPVTNHWSTGKKMPEALSAYSLTEYEGRIYLFGGWDGNHVVNDVYIYDYRDDTWSAGPAMPTARAYSGSVVVGGKIYVIGGWDGTKGLEVNEVYRPDNPVDGSPWGSAPPLPSGRYGMGITNLADIIFILGGIDTSDNLTTIALSPNDTNWGQLESPLPSQWSYLRAITVGTRLYALGGKTGEIASDQMWSYQAIFTITFPIIR